MADGRVVGRREAFRAGSAPGTRWTLGRHRAPGGAWPALAAIVLAALAFSPSLVGCLEAEVTDLGGLEYRQAGGDDSPMRTRRLSWTDPDGRALRLSVGASEALIAAEADWIGEKGRCAYLGPGYDGLVRSVAGREDPFLRDLAAHLAYGVGEEIFALRAVSLIQQEVPLADHPPDGAVGSPIRTLFEGGDAEDRAVLALAIFRAGGCGCAMICFDSHAMASVALGRAPHGSQKTLHFYASGGRTYYAAECSAGPYRIGDVPPAFEGVAAVVIPFEAG